MGMAMFKRTFAATILDSLRAPHMKMRGFEAKRARKFTRTSPRTLPWNFITMLSTPLNPKQNLHPCSCFAGNLSQDLSLSLAAPEEVVQLCGNWRKTLRGIIVESSPGCKKNCFLSLPSRRTSLLCLALGGPGQTHFEHLMNHGLCIQANSKASHLYNIRLGHKFAQNIFTQFLK